MLAIAVLCAICAGAEFFLGYFLLALCRNKGRSEMIGYVIVESDRSCESEVVMPERMLRSDRFGIREAEDQQEESSEVRCGATTWKGTAVRSSGTALSEAICSIRSHRAAFRP
jgi:hypothetical protein